MVPASLTPRLASSADAAINAVLRTGAPGQATPTGEVGFVAAIVLGAVKDIARAWRPILNPHGYSVQLTGVFCHQTPRASFTDASGNARVCELADLLVVADDLTTGSPTRRYAALVQAKMANVGGGKTLTSGGDLIQLSLMSVWPVFTLPASFGSAPRDFATCSFPGAKVDCGRYGLIEPQPSPRWEQHAPANTMPQRGHQLGTFLANMIETGQVGFGREATGTSDDWSRTVDDLMRVTASMAFTYAAGFKGSQARQNVKVAFSSPMVFAGPQLMSWKGSAPPSGGYPGSLDEGPGGEGLSFLHLAIGRTAEVASPATRLRSD